MQFFIIVLIGALVLFLFRLYHLGNDDYVLAKKNITLDDLVKNQNFITMKQDGIIKALLGLTTMEEILRTVNI